MRDYCKRYYMKLYAEYFVFLLITVSIFYFVDMFYGENQLINGNATTVNIYVSTVIIGILIVLSVVVDAVFLFFCRSKATAVIINKSVVNFSKFMAGILSSSILFFTVNNIGKDAIWDGAVFVALLIFFLPIYDFLWNSFLDKKDPASVYLRKYDKKTSVESTPKERVFFKFLAVIAAGLGFLIFWCLAK